MADLLLTGERTVPGESRENYWFRRHEAAYAWACGLLTLTGQTVVDAGSGEGYGAEMLRRAGAARVLALEYDDEAARHSSRTYREVHTIRANLDGLPLPDGCADALVTMQVIEHLWDLRGFLVECRRVLRPGGVIVAATPNRLTFSPGLPRGAKPVNPFHVEEFDAEQIASLLAEAGFAEVTTWGVRHGPGIAADLVPRQIAAVLTDSWPADLLRDVEAVTAADFAVSRDGIDSCLDLIGVGRVREAT